MNKFNELIEQRGLLQKQQNEVRKKLIEIQLVLQARTGFNIGDTCQFKESIHHYGLFKNWRFYITGFAFDNHNKLRAVCNWKEQNSKKPNISCMWFNIDEIELSDD